MKKDDNSPCRGDDSEWEWGLDSNSSEEKRKDNTQAYANFISDMLNFGKIEKKRKPKIARRNPSRSENYTSLNDFLKSI